MFCLLFISIVVDSNSIILLKGKSHAYNNSCAAEHIFTIDEQVASVENLGKSFVVKSRNIGSTELYIKCKNGETKIIDVIVTTPEGLLAYDILTREFGNGKRYHVSRNGNGKVGGIADENSQLLYQKEDTENNIEVILYGDRLLVTGYTSRVEDFLKIRGLVNLVSFPITNLLIMQPERMRVLAEVIASELADAGIRVSVKVMGNSIFIEGIVPDTSTKRKMISIVEAYTKNYVDLVEVGIGKDFVVAIELYLIEVGERDLKEIGINWPLVIDFPVSLQLGLSGTDSTSIENSESSDGDIDRRRSVSERQSGGVSFGISGSAQFLNGLRLLLQKGKSRVLSSPKVIVKNNQSVRFVVGGKLPIPSITTVGGAQTTAIEFVDFGIVIEATPSVDMSRNVSMVVRAELSEPSRDIAVQNVPGFISRSIQTVILLRDRNTLMLSGLSTKADSKTVKKVPILGSIPIIGEFFKSRNMDVQYRELIIFITPYVYSVDEIQKLERKEIDRMKEKYEEYKDVPEIKITD